MTVHAHVSTLTRGSGTLRMPSQGVWDPEHALPGKFGIIGALILLLMQSEG